MGKLMQMRILHMIMFHPGAPESVAVSNFTFEEGRFVGVVGSLLLSKEQKNMVRSQVLVLGLVIYTFKNNFLSLKYSGVVQLLLFV